MKKVKGLPRDQTREAQEGDAHQPGGDEGDGQPAHGLGNVADLHPLAQTGHQHQGQGEAHPGAHGVDQGLDEVVALVDVEHGQAEDCAVGGYQGQVDAQGLVEPGHGLLHDDLDGLHQAGDDQDEEDGAHPGQVQGDQHEAVDQPGEDRGEEHHEDDSHAHADGGVGLLADAQIGAEAQKAHQHEVVDEHGADEEQDQLDTVTHGCSS